MSITEYDVKIAEAWERGVDPETGEILDELAIKEIEALEMDRAEKVENLCLWVVNMSTELDGIAAYAKTVTERKRALENKLERVKAYLQRVLEGEKFKTDRVAVSYRKTTSVSIDDAEKIPQEYLAYKVETPPDKKKIAEALKAGTEVPGCSLTVSQSMTVK